MFALGIRNIGSKAAALLAEAFGSMDAVMQATAEQMDAIDAVSYTHLDVYKRQGKRHSVRAAGAKKCRPQFDCHGCKAASGGRTLSKPV